MKAHDEAKAATGFDLALYGQEMDNATRALAKMNLILHGCPTGEVWQDNTLASPHFLDAKTGALKTFDFVVANPPFSTKSWTNGMKLDNDPFDRFAFGTPPPKNGDYAFLLHILACLKSTGKGALMVQRRDAALGYKEYLDKLVELTRQVHAGPAVGGYPVAVDSAAKRALFDNLGRDEALALRVDAEVRASMQDDWRASAMKTKRVRQAIAAAVGDDQALVEQALALVRSQNDY